MDKTLNIAIVGFGHMGRRHAKILAAVPISSSKGGGAVQL